MQAPIVAGSPGKMSKREQLENSLKELQNDISSLSEKLTGNVSLLSDHPATEPMALPAATDRAEGSLPPPPPNANTSASLSKDIISTILSKTTSPSNVFDSNFSSPTSTPSGSPSRRVVMSSPNVSTIVNENSSTPKIQRVLSEISKQRDKSIEKVKDLQKENIQLRAKLHEMERYKEMCEALERERESLSLSLQSSERIRKQQKDLIKLLQENGGRVSGKGDSSMSMSMNMGVDDGLMSIGGGGGVGGGGESFSFIDLGRDFSTSSFAVSESPSSAKRPPRKKSVMGGASSGRKKSLKPGGSVSISPASSPKARERTLSAPNELTLEPSRSRRPSTASTSSIKSSKSSNPSPKASARKLSLKGSPSTTTTSGRKMSLMPQKTSARKMSLTPQKTSRKLSMLSVKIPSVGGGGISSETKVKTKISTARRHTTVGHKKH
ncbi:hypothetical protein TrVE_jg10629 [Triparma verrucosa]|uniref:Uncharacterized protein n=1 Tax=Triparma verrucosa TaxID=1606542 RepID=A0A9W7F434_9STRA|nr:hypothetical protein TrVE_jg10629 [Triparma verrucosa]